MLAFALFFPVEVAVAATAIVHLANNIFEVLLVGRKADPGVVFKFALAAFVGAFIGSRLLKKITMRIIQTIVGIMLLVLVIALGIGLFDIRLCLLLGLTHIQSQQHGNCPQRRRRRKIISMIRG